MVDVVPTDSLLIARGEAPSDRDVRMVGPQMANQGLIEPLKLDRKGFVTSKYDPWDPARLEYARQNNWPTVIVAPGWEE